MDKKIKISEVRRYWALKYQNAFTQKQLGDILKSAKTHYQDKIKSIDAVKINDDIISLLIDVSENEHVVIRDATVNIIVDEPDEEKIKIKLNKIGASINSTLGNDMGKYDVVFDTEKIIFDNFDLKNELLKKDLLERLQTQYAKFGNSVLISCVIAIRSTEDKEDEGLVISLGYNSPKDYGDNKVTMVIDDEQLCDVAEKLQ